MIVITFCVILCAILTNGDDAKSSLNCGKNEVENACPKFGATDPDCESLLSGFKKNCPPAPDNYQCTPRCDCKKDFVRIGTNCVSADQCCTGKNEEIVNCPADCEDTCLGKPYPGCKLTPCFNKGCRCKNNFVRHEGSCISRKDCPEKMDLPQVSKPLQCIGGKAKKAVNDALKKAEKAKIVVAKNFVKRNTTDAVASAVAKVVLPVVNLTTPLAGLTVKTGLPGKQVLDITPPCNPTDENPINPLEATKNAIAEKLAKRLKV